MCNMRSGVSVAARAVENEMYTGKHIVILGAARQGKALARYLVTHGARVTLNDAGSAESIVLGDLAGRPGLTTVFGGHPLSLLDGCDLLCLSGGVPIDLPIVLEAKRRGILLSNDAQIFFEVCPAPIIGITGSAGKTTTTTLVGEILKKSIELRMQNTDQRTAAGGVCRRQYRQPADQRYRHDSARRFCRDGAVVVPARTNHALAAHRMRDEHHAEPSRPAWHPAGVYRRQKAHSGFPDAADIQVLSADDPVASTLNTHARTIWFSLKMEPMGEGAWLDEAGNLRIRLRPVDSTNQLPSAPSSAIAASCC